MATPKSNRASPARIFENYVLTKNTGPGAGLTRVHQNRFTPVKSFFGSPFFQVTTPIDLGFDFIFDQVRYTKIILAQAGWVYLVDPDRIDTDNGGVSLAIDSSSGSYENQGILPENTERGVVCAVWFDALNHVTDEAPGSSTEMYNRGIFTPELIYNHSAYGISICYDKSSPRGRRTIVRWAARSGQDVIGSAVIKFECVFYESGHIEFRYDKKTNLPINLGNSSPVKTSATMGIFASGTYRFRDFAYGLGKDQQRQQYKYGGAVYDPNFNDSYLDSTYGQISRPYVISLNPNIQWPGSTDVGAIYTFSPPQNRRKVLPRRLLQQLDSQENTLRYFDDRRTATYLSGVVVNYPTTLPRFFGDTEASVTSRQTLFNGSGNELELTGSVVKSLIDQSLEIKTNDTIDPFNESLDYSTFNDTFFTEGSGVDSGLRLDQPLQSKSQIQISLNVEYVTELFGDRAVLYYFNVNSKAWLMPRNSVTGDAELYSFFPFSDVANPVDFATNQRIIEDHRGFGPVGNLIGSGSNEPSSTRGTDYVINAPYAGASVMGQSVDSNEAMNRPLSKTFLTNANYEANVTERLNLPDLQYPFLVEKATFDIPFAAGQGWFNDRTTNFMPLVSSPGSFDFAGPGLTVALLNQITVGNSTRRDLIMTGTITHSNDYNAEILLSSFGAYSSVFQMRPSGFRAYGKPSCVVAAPAAGSVTGSLHVKTEALISNGVTLKMTKDMVSATPASNRAAAIELLDQPQLKLISSSAEYAIGYNIAYVNGFGRSGNASSSPRSVFGKDFISSQGGADRGVVKNPFYLTGSARDALVSRLTSDTSIQDIRANAAISLESHVRSPYLIKPGDDLVLALAKSRPFFYSSGVGGPETSGSITHDFRLLTGTINITLYGSYLKEGQEFHDVYKPQTSNVVRDVIGNEPVLDQFDAFYRDEWIGSTFDDYVTGSLVTRVTSADQTSRFTIGNRTKLFSKVNARSAGNINGDVKSESFIPWYERVGLPVATATSPERYWDSLMPRIDQCFKADGCQIVLNTGLTTSGTTNNGLMGFNRVLSSDSNQQRNFNDKKWAFAYPFEPRYAKVSRQRSIDASFVATAKLDGSTFTPIEPTRIDNLFLFTPVHRQGYEIVFDPFQYWGDVRGGITGSAGRDDVVRILYGFGDEYMLYDSMIPGVGLQGLTHWPTFRNTAAIPSNVSMMAYGPIIRGWKYGVISGLPLYSRAVFRTSKYGQFRDMLEQMPYTKFYVEGSTALSAPVQVRFVDAKGNTTRPENTQSQNLSFEVTSSVPFFDGEIRNRNDINLNTQNTNIVNLSSDQFGNVNL